jgi:hypothetical protein
VDVRPGLVHLDLDGLGVDVLDGGIGVWVLESGAGVGILGGSAGAGVVERGSALLDVKFGCKFGVVCLARGAGVGDLVWGAEAGAGVGGLVRGAEAGARFVRAAGVLDRERGALNASAELVRSPLLSECA